MKGRKIKWQTIVLISIFLVVCCISTYIMLNGIGMIEGVQCGPGQYYYTDIPNWRDYFLREYYVSPVPTSVLIILFFAWGFFMYKVWAWVDKKF